MDCSGHIALRQCCVSDIVLDNSIAMLLGVVMSIDTYHKINMSPLVQVALLLILFGARIVMPHCLRQCPLGYCLY